MSMLDYWREALQAALEDVDAIGVLTPEQIDGAAKVLLGARETESQWDGSDCIPNPEIAEAKRARDGYAKKVAQLMEEAHAYKCAFARAIGVEPVRVGMNHGDIEVYRQ